MRRPLLALALPLLLAPGALASGHNMRVNEISPALGKVELLDVLPGGDLLNSPEGYAVRSYDGAGNEVAAQSYLPPTPFANSSAAFVLDLALPAGAGQVCFERGRNPESTKPLEEYRQHCLGYGAVTNPVMRRMEIGGPRPIAMPVTAAPGPEQSVQRQPCGRAGLGPPTFGAENAAVPAACAGVPVCDDPRKADNRPPKMKVELGKSQRVGRFHATFTLSEDGDVTLRGSIIAGRIRTHRSGPIPNGFVYGPIRRNLKARTATRVPIPIPRKARRAVKRGEQSVGYVITTGRDNACFRNRAHSSRQVTLVP